MNDRAENFLQKNRYLTQSHLAVGMRNLMIGY